MTGQKPGITIPDLFRSHGTCALCPAKISRYKLWCRKCTFRAIHAQIQWVREKQAGCVTAGCMRPYRHYADELHRNEKRETWPMTPAEIRAAKAKR